MKYAGEAVRKWVIEELSGIEIGSKVIPVYNLARIDQAAPYVLVVNQTQNGVVTKEKDCAMATVNIMAVTEFFGDYGGDQMADRIASEISQRLTGAEGEQDGLKITVLSLDANESTMQIDQTRRVITRNLAYQIFVEL